MQKNGLIGQMNLTFKIHDVKISEINYCNAHIAQYLKK